MSVESKQVMAHTDVVNHNREAWNSQVVAGNPWTIPATAAEMSRARSGDWHVLLTPNIHVPVDWFLPMAGCRILCLASGGGQQGPIFAAAGAIVTVFDNSPAQLESDRMVATRYALTIRTVQGDMADLSCFPSGSFDLVFHPVSNVFAPDVRPVWREAARVLRDGGVLLAGFNNPAMYIFDQDAAERGELVPRHALPYSDIIHLDPARLAEVMRKNMPLEFSHTLQDQIGGECEAGFAITAMYEDHDAPGHPHPLDRYMPLYIATRAIKLPSHGSPVVMTAPVDRDLPCVRCGYNLRTLDSASRCPECGASVALTLELGGELQQARPAYLGRLAAGCWLLFASRAAVTLVVLFAALIEDADWLFVPIALAGALYAVGNYLLTCREHPRLPPEMPAINISLRLCSAGVLLGLLLILLAYGAVPYSMYGRMRYTVLEGVSVGTSVLYCVCPLLEMLLLVRLSRRVSDTALHEYAIIGGLGATISGLAAIALVVRDPGINSLAGMCLWLAVLVAILLFWIWTAYTSLMSASHLTQAWGLAKARWLKHAPNQD